MSVKLQLFSDIHICVRRCKERGTAQFKFCLKSQIGLLFQFVGIETSRSVRRSVCHNFVIGRKFHFHAPIEELVYTCSSETLKII